MKLHLGCGKRYIPGFVHVDAVKFPHVDHVQDIRSLSNFDSSCAELVYACQVFEYFDREEGPQILAEWVRVLKPGGVLRLSVPDFDVMARLYVAGFPLEFFLGTLYGKIPQDGGGSIYHRTIYDERSLRRALEAAGLIDVSLWDWRTTEHSGIDDFSQAYVPHMDKERGLLFNLNMQGVRET
jgi:ubiquinone/menaquinone biosynthesis C-methylase UbiE